MLTRSEKSYGGYSTHSLPTRNADNSLESGENISFLLDIYTEIEKSDRQNGKNIVNLLMKKNFKQALSIAKNPNTIKLITTALELNSNANQIRLAKNDLVSKLFPLEQKNEILSLDTMNGNVVIAYLEKGKFDNALNSTMVDEVKKIVLDLQSKYEKEIKNLKRLLEK